MSRYATLMEPSTAPQTPPEAAPKHASEAPVVPLASPGTPQVDEYLSPMLPEAAIPEEAPDQEPKNIKPASKHASMHARKPADLSGNIHACMQEIIDESGDLKRAGVQSLSVRVPADDFKWLRKVTNSYNDELDQKFNQGLFVRIGLKFLKAAMTYDPQMVRDLLEEIK